MHPEYVEKAPRGAGWYILLEDGTLLQGGPYPSEEATWAEVALRESREEAEHGRATPPPAEAAQSPSRILRVGEDCSASPQRLYLAISGQAMNADAGSST